MVLRNPNGRFRSKGSFDSNEFGARNTLSEGIANFEIKMKEGFEDIVEKFRSQIEDYAKKNAPWSDRTGDARQGLSTEVDSGRDNSFGITLYHTVDYGVFLEVRWGGRYGIIIPTIENMGPKMMAELRGMMDRIVFYE